jgi:hypothetical protein
MITKNFNIPLNDEPYKDTKTLNKVWPATYNGPRYIKVQIDSTTHFVDRYVYMTDKSEEMNSFDNYPKEPGKYWQTIDATINPFEAAYVTGLYDTGVTDNYQTELGTLDDNGDPETYEFGYDDQSGMIAQTYYSHELKFQNGAWVMPRFRVHALSRQQFLDSLQTQIQGIEKGLAENTELTEEQKTKLLEYKTWLENVPTKYAAVDHWKIPFKHQVPVY